MNKPCKILGLLAILSLTAIGACSAPESQQSAKAPQAENSYADDATITANIKASLLKDQAMKSFDIHVETENSVVQLSGFVDSPLQKANAQRIAENAAAVKSVKNNIILR